MSDHVLIDRDDTLMYIVLNRAEKKNAISNAMYTRICEGLDDAAADRNIRVVVIRSSCADFTSGNDLKDFATVNRGATDLENLPVLRLLRTVVGFDKPLVSVVRGQAVGIGTTLLLHCDLVFAGQSAVFQMPFVPLGLVPEFASSYLLPLIAGRARANLALLLGEPFDAKHAAEMGLLSRLCSDAEVEDIAIKQCRKLAGMPPKSVRAAKRLITPPEMQQQLLNIIQRESAIFARQLQSAEHREALAAFFEKRQPDFSAFE
jgi:enoyl-CoA hydratase/carnithine racemase